jgi:S1-C subfamily serine protease
LIEPGKVIRPGLGIGVLENHVRERYVGKKGVALSFVDPDGPAGQAGLKGMMRDRFGRIYIGDVIIKINKDEVNSLDEVYHQLGQYKIGETITVHFLRNGKMEKVQVKLKQLY